MQPFRLVLMMILLPFVSACGALNAISDASNPMNAYTLSPLGSGDSTQPAQRHLIVELPTSAGALANDRIQIKPMPFQAQYLPDGRWSEPAPALVQSLLVASLQNSGGFRLVGRGAAGLMPDYTLMTELQEMHAAPTGAAPLPLTVRITTVMTLIREADRRIVASRRFTASVGVQTDDTATLVSGFDLAMRQMLQDAVIWTSAQAR